MFKATGRLHPISLILALIAGMIGTIASYGPWPYPLAGTVAILAWYSVTIGWLRGVFEIMSSRLEPARRPRDKVWA